MDERRVDVIARALANGLPRRRLLGGLGAGALAALVGRGTAAGAPSGSCKNDGRKCKKKKDCCSKLCQGGRCRCLKAGKECPIGFAAKCCGALVCGANPCGEGGTCCFPRGAVGCTADCDCCGSGPPLTVCGGAPQSRFCCSTFGASCIADAQCCSLNCFGGTCT